MTKKKAATSKTSTPVYGQAIHEVIETLRQKNISPEAARVALEMGMRQAKNMAEFLGLYETAKKCKVPTAQTLLPTLAKLGCVVREWDFVLKITTVQEPAPALLVYRAFALHRQDKTNEAQKLIKMVLKKCNGELLGWALRIKASCLAQQNQTGWKEIFDKATTQLKGRALGTCLSEYGSFLLAAGESKKARRIWLQALPLLKHDPYYCAWLHHDLGILCLNDLLLTEAETHFLEMFQASKKNTAKEFARAWCGIGAARRAMGEWPRAEAAYREAIKRSVEKDDLQAARWGLGHTLRLAGRPDLAHEQLNHATKLGADWAWAEVAAMWLMLDDEDAATDALTQFKPNNNGDEQQAMIVRAEMARRNGKIKTALQELKKVDMKKLWTSEEQRCFPKLFQLATQHKLGKATKLKQVEKMIVRIQTKGVLRLHVNSRPIKLRPTGRAAELLALLLELGSTASNERLIELLFPNMTNGPTERRKKTRALWQLVKELRQVLGWQESVVALSNAYELDPSSTWQYDRQEDKNKKRATPNYLEGMYADWAENLRLGHEI